MAKERTRTRWTSPGAWRLRERGGPTPTGGTAPGRRGCPWWASSSWDLGRSHGNSRGCGGARPSAGSGACSRHLCLSQAVTSSHKPQHTGGREVPGVGPGTGPSGLACSSVSTGRWSWLEHLGKAPWSMSPLEQQATWTHPGCAASEPQSTFASSPCSASPAHNPLSKEPQSQSGRERQDSATLHIPPPASLPQKVPQQQPGMTTHLWVSSSTFSRSREQHPRLFCRGWPVT